MLSTDHVADHRDSAAHTLTTVDGLSRVESRRRYCVGGNGTPFRA